MNILDKPAPEAAEELIGKLAAGADIALIEANHDLQMLRDGPYPFPLKRRILSDHGHLSNDDCALLARYLAENGTKQFILGHLSRENNFPEMALTTMENILRENACRPSACIVRVLSGNEVSEIYEWKK